MKREIDEGKMLFALRFSEGVQKTGPIFIANPKLDVETKKVQALQTVQDVLHKFKDAMPAELSKKLSLRGEVDNTIELEPLAKPPTFSHYHMEELRRQLKELLNIGYIHPTKSSYGVPLLF